MCRCSSAPAGCASPPITCSRKCSAGWERVSARSRRRSSPRAAPTATTTTTNPATAGRFTSSASRMIDLRLLQLASPALPVGAYSYSQGLEAAVDAGIVRDAASATRWIGDVLELSLAAMEAPILLRLVAAWHAGDAGAVARRNPGHLACRSTSELRAAALHMCHV